MKITYVKKKKSEQSLVCEDVKDIPSGWINDWKPMNFIEDESANGREEAGIRIDPDQVFDII